MVIRDAQISRRPRRHDDDPGAREPGTQVGAPHIEALSGVLRPVGRGVCALSVEAHRGQRIQADQLQRAIADADVPVHDRRKGWRGGDAGDPARLQPYVQALIDSIGSADDLVRRCAVHGIHRQLEGAARTRRRNIHGHDGSDSYRKANERESQLRRVSQKVASARGPQGAHSDFR